MATLDQNNNSISVASNDQDNKKQNSLLRLVVPIETCELTLDSLLLQLHLKANDEAIKTADNLIILNSAFEGEGTNSKFYGAGQHIIAAIPKENHGLDKNNVDKEQAFKAILIYVQWFVGPDEANNLKIDKLLRLEDENSQKTEDTSEKKANIEKSRSDNAEATASKEKYNENPNLTEAFRRILTFGQYLLIEAGKESENSSDKTPEKSDDKDQEPKKDQDDKLNDDKLNNDKQTDEDTNDTASGWYISYLLDIPGLKNHPLSDALKKVGKSIFDKIGIRFFNSLSGVKGDIHTIGGLRDSLSGIFGRIDPKELEAKYSENLRLKVKDGEPTVKIFDNATLLKYLRKQLTSKDKAVLKKDQNGLSVCTKVDKKDKSYKIYSKELIADTITQSISGLFKKFKNKISPDDVILVNNYSENKKNRGDIKYTELNGEGQVKDSLLPILHGNLIVEDGETTSSEKSEASENSDNKENIENSENKINESERIEEILKELLTRAQTLLKDLLIDAFVGTVDDGLTQYLKNADVSEKQKDNFKLYSHLFVIKTKYNKTVGESISKVNLFLNMLFEEKTTATDTVKAKVKRVFEDVLYKFKEQWFKSKKKVNIQDIEQLEPINGMLEESKFESSEKLFNLLFEDSLYEDDSKLQDKIDDLSKKLRDDIMTFGKAHKRKKDPPKQILPNAGCDTTQNIISLLQNKNLLTSDAEKKLSNYKYAFWFWFKKAKSVDEKEYLGSYAAPSYTEESMSKIFLSVANDIELSETYVYTQENVENIKYNKSDVSADVQICLGFITTDLKSEKITETIVQYWAIPDANRLIKGNKPDEYFNLKFVSTDPEDPDNTGSQKTIANIIVFKGKYKANDIRQLAKTDKNPDLLSKIADDNEEQFKHVLNISALEKEHEPYKFLGWTIDANTADKESTIETIEDIIKTVQDSGEDKDDVIVRTVWQNDIKTIHTDLDFYIVYMPGLKDKPDSEPDRNEKIL